MTAALAPGRPFTGTERQLLENTLQLHRSELIAAAGGLSDAQARLHLVPSLRTRISLVKHCAAADRIWFQRLGRPAPRGLHRPSRRWQPQLPRRRLLNSRPVVAEYVAACATSDDTAARHDLDDTAQHSLVGAVSLRFIYLGLIAEIARHAGPADILVEQVRAIPDNPART
jgi:Protein of unknown function (DUF664)